MRSYEPQWSAEEQTMVDLMLLSGCKLEVDITEDYCRIGLYYPNLPHPFHFNSDTEYESIRKCFNTWANDNGKN
jgi:hypothetical protein